MRFYTSAEIKGIKQHIKEQTATKEEIEVVLDDLFDHLDLRLTNLPHNYSGIFGQDAIEDIRKNYKEFFPKEMEEMIIEDKRHDFFDMIYRKIINNESIPKNIEKILDYIENKKNDKNEENGIRYVVVGYPTSETGNKTQPVPKQ